MESALCRSRFPCPAYVWERIRSVGTVKRCTGRTEWFVLFRVFALTWFTSPRCHYPQGGRALSLTRSFLKAAFQVTVKDFHRKRKLIFTVYDATITRGVFYKFFFGGGVSWQKKNQLHFLSASQMRCSKWISFWEWRLLIGCSSQLLGMTCKPVCFNRCSKNSTLFWVNVLVEQLYGKRLR